KLFFLMILLLFLKLHYGFCKISETIFHKGLYKFSTSILLAFILSLLFSILVKCSIKSFVIVIFAPTFNLIHDMIMRSHLNNLSRVTSKFTFSLLYFLSSLARF